MIIFINYFFCVAQDLMSWFNILLDLDFFNQRKSFIIKPLNLPSKAWVCNKLNVTELRTIVLVSILPQFSSKFSSNTFIYLNLQTIWNLFWCTMWGRDTSFVVLFCFPKWLISCHNNPYWLMILFTPSNVLSKCR